MAKDIYRKHEFVPGPIGISWCDVTEDGHLCGRRAHHAIHQPRRVRHSYLDTTGNTSPTARHCYRCDQPRSAHL